MRERQQTKNECLKMILHLSGCHKNNILIFFPFYSLPALLIHFFYYLAYVSVHTFECMHVNGGGNEVTAATRSGSQRVVINLYKLFE